MNISTTALDNSSLPYTHLGRMQSTPPNGSHSPSFGDLNEPNHVLPKPSSGLEKAAEPPSKPLVEPLKRKVGYENSVVGIENASVKSPSLLDNRADMAITVDSEKPHVKKKRARKKWKKPKDKPNRPLSAYNLFFREERAKMLGSDTPTVDSEKKRLHRKTHGKVGFTEMARSIGAKWKELSEEEKKGFNEQAAEAKKRYAVDLAEWNEQQKRKASETKHTEKKAAVSAQDGAANLLRMRMIAEGDNRSNLSISQQRPSQDLATIEYLRNAERAILSRSNLNPALFQYPNAAEASASAILQQFQNMQRQQQSQVLDASVALSLYPSALDFSYASEVERLQQLRLQSAINLSGGQTLPIGSSREIEMLRRLRLQSAMQQPASQFGSATVDLDKIPLSQYPGNMAAAMRRFRYNM